MAREALDDAGAARRSRASASPTSARPWWPGTRAPASRCTARSSGRTAAPPRAATSCARPGASRSFRERTGLVLDPYFSGHEDRVAAARGRRAAPERGVRHRSTPGSSSSSPAAHVTDYSNASRTLLFDIRTLELGPGAVRDPGRAPGVAARARAERARCYGEHRRELGGSVPVAGIAGDQQAALYGQACHTPGLGKNTYGTGSFVLQNAGARGAAAGGRAAHHRGLGGGGPRGLRARGGDLRDRRGGAVAARRRSA